MAPLAEGGSGRNQRDTSVANWQWYDRHVTSELKSGEFISAATVLVAAGPPMLQDAGVAAQTTENGPQALAEIAYPLGLIENFGVSQNRQLQRMFEIGSKRSYFIPGRTIGSLSLGRVLFYGPSIMRVLYSYYPTNKKYYGPRGGKQGVANQLGTGQMEGVGENLAKKNFITTVNDLPGYGRQNSANIGSENADFWINLASDLFDKPFGLLCLLRDHRDTPYGAFYLEDCNLQAHQFNINASSVMVAEGVSAQYDKMVPLAVSAGRT